MEDLTLKSCEFRELEVVRLWLKYARYYGSFSTSRRSEVIDMPMNSSL